MRAIHERKIIMITFVIIVSGLFFRVNHAVLIKEDSGQWLDNSKFLQRSKGQWFKPALTEAVFFPWTRQQISE